MDLAALQEKKQRLKKVEQIQERTLPTIVTEKDASNVEFSEGEIETIKEFHFLTNIDKWLTKLPENVIIPTLTLPLSIAQGAALYRNCKNISPEYPLPHATIFELPKERIDEELANLTQEIDKLVDKVNGKKFGCFIKLSCRSPKDATPCGSIAQTLYDSYCCGSNQKDINFHIQALYKASLGALKVHSAEEGLSLLLQSKRIAFDLGLDLKFVSKFSLSVVVRPWIEIPLISEFRAFVFEGKLTAISQYYTQCFFKELESLESKFFLTITNFFNSIKHHLDFLPKYVIDFAVLDDKVIVIELNPFHPSTSPCLFDWEKDADLLEKGPLAFRYHKTPIGLTAKEIPSEWAQWLKEKNVW